MSDRTRYVRMVRALMTAECLYIERDSILEKYEHWLTPNGVRILLYVYPNNGAVELYTASETPSTFGEITTWLRKVGAP